MTNSLGRLRSRVPRAAPERRPSQDTIVASFATPLVSAIKHSSLDDKIYQNIRELIMTRRIPPGGRIPIDRLTREMGVSRTPIVNALKRLGQEQVIEWVPRRGVFVTKFTTRDLARLFEVREMLEGLAAARAAQRISPAEVEDLRALFRGLDLTPHGPALQRYIDTDRSFHWRLVELADNRHLAHAMQSVNLMVFTYQMGLARPPAETVQEHWAILDALKRRDAEASETAMRLHLRRSRECLDAEADAEEARGRRGRTTARQRRRGELPGTAEP